MQFTRSQIEQLVAQAREHAPYETCGLIGGKDGRALKIYPIKNIAPDRVKRYLMEPQEQFNALSEIDKNGWDLAVIYHSHPATPAYPSPTDLNDAYDPTVNEELYPGTLYVLISLANPALAQVRAYEFKQRAIHEVTLEAEEDVNHEERQDHQVVKKRKTSERAGKRRSGEATRQGRRKKIKK